MKTFIHLITIFFYAVAAVSATQAPAGANCTMACDALQTVYYDNANLQYKVCDFEIKYSVKSYTGNVVQMNFLYAQNMTVSVQCPDAAILVNGVPSPFPHIAELECKEQGLDLDLYLPAIHLRGTGSVLKQSVNSNPPFNITM